MTSLSGLDVVILAGGAGTRLSCMMPDRPKVLATVDGRPFLDYLIEQVRDAGARRVILSLGFCHEAVEAYVAGRGWSGVRVERVVEPSPRGTGGALAEVAPAIRSPEVLIMNGDTFARVDLGALVDFHRATKARCSLAATRVLDTSRYGLVETDETGRVTSFIERPARPTAGCASVGLYVADANVLEAIPKGRMLSFERDVLPSVDPLYAMIGSYDFLDIGTPESLGAAPAFFGKRGA